MTVTFFFPRGDFMKGNHNDSMDRLLNKFTAEGCEKHTDLLHRKDYQRNFAHKYLQNTHDIKNANHYVGQGLVYGMLAGQ